MTTTTAPCTDCGRVHVNDATAHHRQLVEYLMEYLHKHGGSPRAQRDALAGALAFVTLLKVQPHVPTAKREVAKLVGGYMDEVLRGARRAVNQGRA
jgi:hypothetical protein